MTSSQQDKAVKNVQRLFEEASNAWESAVEQCPDKNHEDKSCENISRFRWKCSPDYCPRMIRP